jgi:hypothetical protein
MLQLCNQDVQMVLFQFKSNQNRVNTSDQWLQKKGTENRIETVK